MDWDELNKCLRGELGSVETYQQALERDRQRFGHEVEFQKLSDILKEHQEAASQLQAQIQGGPEGLKRGRRERCQRISRHTDKSSYSR